MEPAKLASSRSILVGKFLPTNLPTGDASYSPFQRLGICRYAACRVRWSLAGG